MNKFLANLIALTAISIVFSSVFSSGVSAQYGQYGQYGQPEPSLSIMIDKMVGKPFTTKGGTNSADFVDNLSPSDLRFQPGDEVLFKLKVKNTSDEKLKNVSVTDFLPDFVQFVDGKGGFNADSRELTIAVGDLEVDEEKEYIVNVKVMNQEQLPADKGLMCLVNKATASNESVSDDDTAQFCIEKDVQGITSVPSAGPEQGIALILGQLSALGLGVFLKRKSS